MKWICTQIGAREHYAVPRVLHAEGKLESLYTDFWADDFWKSLGWLPGMQGLSTRHHDDLRAARVYGFHLGTLKSKFLQTLHGRNPYEGFVTVGRNFGKSVRSSLMKKKGVNWEETIFFGYDTGFLEPARWVKSMGGKAVVCQIDPSRSEMDLVIEEEELMPNPGMKNCLVPESYFRRREAEWSESDLVIVNSLWSKRGLISQGVKDEKIAVVPLAYETSAGSMQVGLPKVAPQSRAVQNPPSSSANESSFDTKQPLRVLFLGQVIPRKGIRYLIEAATIMQCEPIRFDVVGPIGIPDEIISSAPRNMTFHGPVPRNRTEECYESADLFVLPTLSDGFALTQLEAMSRGLPVITTQNCGDVVTPGEDGMIVPPRSAEAIVAVLREMMHRPDLVATMSKEALLKARCFSLDRLALNLRDIEHMVKSI
jgi:glycosyltransferase involved in cell wall biosynthesis